jgi:hypothetical protein
VVAEFDDAAVDRYGLKPVGRPVRCSFSCYLITLERAMRHPALAVIAGESEDVFKTKSVLK